MYDGGTPSYADIYLYHNNSVRWDIVKQTDIYGGQTDYTFSGLATGEYRLYVYASYQGAEFDEWYEDANSLEEATIFKQMAHSPTPLLWTSISVTVHDAAGASSQDEVMVIISPRFIYLPLVTQANN